MLLPTHPEYHTHRFLLQDDNQQHDEEDFLTFGDTPVERATVVMNQLAALISLLSILCIVLEAGHDVANRKGTVVARTLLGWSVGSVCVSSGFLMGTWPIPKSLDDYVWGASGNQGTCTLQGVLVTTGLLLAVLWDIALSLTYVWMIRYSWPTAKLEKWEKAVHVIIWPCATIFLALGLVDGAFNASRDICYLAPAPYGCELENEDMSSCTRGLNSLSLLAILPLSSIFGVMVGIGSMIALYCTVRDLEKKNEAYTRQYTNKSSKASGNFSSGLQRNSVASAKEARKQNKLSQQVGIQGILYSSIWLLAGCPTLVVILLWAFAGIFHEGVYLVTQTLGVLYGFWYTLVYLRRREEMKTTYGRLAKKLLCCLCCKQVCGQQTEEQDTNPNNRPMGNITTESIGDLSGPLPNTTGVEAAA